MNAAVIVLIVVVIVALAAILFYNRLVKLRNRVDSGWSQIDVQLQRRYDLIPNLVETVKGYATHEADVFEQVTQARSQAMQAEGPAQQGQAENQISGALKSLFAVAEAYPDLKANQNFSELQEELSGTEGRIAYARQFYNETVLTYNTALQQFPGSVVAGPFNFTKREFFEIEGGPEARGPVKVQF